GDVDIALVDRAVERVLTQKCELGMLDGDWAPDLPVSVDMDCAESRSLALVLARRSIVLLRNDGTLPLPLGHKVAVIGPRADESSAMLGCYSFPMHVGVHHPDVPIGVEVPTLLSALTSDYDVTYAQGCPVLGGDDAGITEAVRVAAAADTCVLVLGDRAGLFGEGTSGEGGDAASLRLPGRQEELLDAVLATGTPVVLVLLVGRPYELSRQVDQLAAAVCGFFPGEEGATALADVLSGRVNPSGRLPVSFPSAGANQPTTYLASALAQRSEVSVVDPTPVFPFGHGLSYTPATWVDVERRSPELWPTDDVCQIAVTLRNDAAVATTEVVQVYLHDPVAEVARPVRKLIAASRVAMAPGQVSTVVIDLHADLTAYTGRSGRRQVDTGDVELHVGASSMDIRATLPATLTGQRREVDFDRIMAPTITVS
ncbi:MAG TPA: glycoside hydrolase family 3 C-terminal domain-containing protein, partial [Pseudonocardiaceae bacterium]